MNNVLMDKLQPFCKYFACAPCERRPNSIRKSKDTVYFRNGKRKIDVVLVYHSNKPNEERDRFLKNLKKVSLKLEKEISTADPTRVYVKIHGREKLLRSNAQLYGYPVKYNQLTLVPEDEIYFDCLKHILNDPHPDPQNPIAKRAWATVSKAKPTKLTNSERSAIVFTMMYYVPFGKAGEPFKIGLQHLLMKDGFVAAYPLHDGPWEWPADSISPLNDRQLLVKYWASFEQLFKQQPYTIIENYLGPEIGMYFAWLGFYNKMLFYAAVMGIAPYIIGIFHVVLSRPKSLDEVCASELYICPSCKKCEADQLKSLCTNYVFSFVHDNIIITLFSCAMSFWSQAFMEYWKRRQNILVIKWNLNTALDDLVRPEFQATAQHVRRHEYTGEMEQYIPLRTKLFSFSVSVSVVFLMMLTVIATILIITLIECFLTVNDVDNLLTSFISSVLTLIVMMIFRNVYGKIALKLTAKENPRTKNEFEKSYMIKMVVFSLLNNYGALIYTAFFKGKFYTYPGDENLRLSYFPISAEVCTPPNCVGEVAILLATITILTPIISNFVEVAIPMIKVWFKHFRIYAKVPTTELYSWEKDYALSSDFDCMDEIEEMVIQYGYVTLFVAAFPLSPLLALLNNIFEIRIDSSKLVKYHKRPIGIYKTSMSVWFDTLQSLTYLAVVTNAFYISFTTNFVPSVIYYNYYNKNYAGYYFFLLSNYKVVDDYWTQANITECYYQGQKYPPGHPKQYMKTDLHYYILSCRLGFAIIFVVLVLFMTAIISYAIPDIPSGIQDLLAYNAKKDRIKKEGGRKLNLS